jgi:uncharacterized protein (TIRG00374 family)
MSTTIVSIGAWAGASESRGAARALLAFGSVPRAGVMPAAAAAAPAAPRPGAGSPAAGSSSAGLRRQTADLLPASRQKRAESACQDGYVVLSDVPASTEEAPRRSRWRSVWLVGRVVVFGALAYAAAQVVLSNSAELSGASSYLRHAGWGWIAVAAGAEALSYLNFALLQRVLLQAGGLRLGIGQLAALSLAGNAITNSLPGGGAFATVFAYRQFRRRGADEALTTWTIVAFTALTAVTLALLAVAGLLIAGEDGQVQGLWPLVAVLIAGPAIGVAILLRPGLLMVVVRRPVGWIDRLTSDHRDPKGAVERLIAKLETVTPRPRQWLFGLLFAGGNWMFDCGCLAASFMAVGAPVPWRGLLVAYGAAQVAANLPITPGGLGVVEGSLTVALVAFGGQTASTVAAVLLYRVISFWLVLPVGWSAWVGIHVNARRSDREVAAL